jgi:hypothetical protein
MFEGTGKVFEYSSPIYGPCSKTVEDCPKCGGTGDEYRKPKQAKSKRPSYCNEQMASSGGCQSGGCQWAG